MKRIWKIVIRYVLIYVLFTSIITFCFMLAVGEPVCHRTFLVSFLYGTVLGASHKMSYSLSNEWRFARGRNKTIGKER